MTDQSDDFPVAQRQRSPRYPFIDLGTAIRRADEIASLSLKHAVPFASVAKAWGFSAASSNMPKVTAALKRFDLADVIGSGAARQVRLTDTARELLFHIQDPESREFKRQVREAAMRPEVYQDLLKEFGLPLPDASVVEHFLVFKRNFNEQAAHDCVLKLRRTIDYAQLTEADLPASSGREEPTAAQPATTPSQPATPPAPPEEAEDGVWRAPSSGPAERHPRVEPPPVSIYDHFSADRTAVQIPYSHGQWATLRATFPLSEAEWAALTAMLNAMKPGLVRSDELADEA